MRGAGAGASSLVQDHLVGVAASALVTDRHVPIVFSERVMGVFAGTLVPVAVAVLPTAE
ncbi:hypothetical protein ACIBU0_31560 [Streptomyces sp. NPDC049627]|uniref:hypothetical protein n=1 Tax=Streptomyces sp. NPDC049627 TaxID=3365595 RepID=UPI0037A4B949